MRVLVCGGRDYAKADYVSRVLDGLSVTTLVHGGARGADILAGHWALRHGVNTEVFYADWARGKRAGPERNQRMLDSKPDLVVAFPGGRGTADMVRRAKAAGIEVIEVEEGA